MAKKKISKKKIETVKKIVELIKNNPTMMIASIKNLPSRQFQDIRKKLRGKAEIVVVKKRVMLKAIDESKLKSLEELKEYVCEDSAVLFSKEDAFDLAALLAENKNLIKAKPRQEAIEDIEVEKGPTDLIPGPAISELGALGIKIAVEDGKIAIKENKIIVRAGERISEAAASIMAKLEIYPFKIGLEPIAVYDSKADKIYTSIKIDREKTLSDLKTAAAKSIDFAQKIVYYCKETIGYLLAKANMNARAIEKLQKVQSKEEKPAEEKEKKKTENTDKKNQIQQETKPEEEK